MPPPNCHSEIMGNICKHFKPTEFEIDYNYLIEDCLLVYRNDDIEVISEGICFMITGKLLLTCERFFIDFLVNNPAQDVALHLSARLPQNYMVRNSRVNKVWGVEENASPITLSLRRGHNFVIQVLVTQSAFLISVNGHHFAAYRHCIPYYLITSVLVKGEVKDIAMQQTRVATYPERLDSIRPIEVVLKSSIGPNRSTRSGYAEMTAPVKGWRFSIVLRVLTWQLELSTPFLGSLPPNIMKPGRFLTIEGRVKLLPLSFFISLQNGVYFWPHPTVAFHLGSYFSNKSENISKAKLVRAAWYDGDWSPEELSYIDTEFLPGKSFRIAIVCVEDAFEVYLNGKYLLDFKYHMRPEVVDTVYICGDVKLNWVSLHSNVEDDGTTLRYFTKKFVKRNSQNSPVSA
ncbi:galectin-4 isoform X1 [Ceratitis capitata]|uniref:galectin-4 isoform X1 n=2 Tax=Ceratitis capitata TaxID=7213 RepID=UPI00032977BA|nr:galectin-4 isoform X1 [Ceratitis capitata]